MQSDREDGFSPINYSDMVNDNESLHMFNIESPSAGSMSIDPTSMFLNTDYAASPLSNTLQPTQPSSSKPSHMLSADTPTLSFSNSPLQPRTALSSTSPESSSHDSSSDSSGRRKRKSPDSPSPSATFSSYNSQNWSGAVQPDTQPQDYQKLRDSPLARDGQKRLKDLDVNIQFINSEMQNNFDFNSAASSPRGSARGMRQMPRPTMDHIVPPIQTTTNTLFTFGSCDDTPPSATFPPSYQASPSVTQGDYTVNPGAVWSAYPLNTPMVSPGNMTRPTTTINPNEVGRLPQKGNVAPQLYVNPIPSKSRVETQIAIKLTLDPMPPGVTKMHLPTHSISKAKLLAKEVETSPDTYELSTTLVCTSAMQNPEYQARALRVARGEETLPKTEGSRRSSTADAKNKHEDSVDPNDPNLPLNGGEVKICDNCINRERKRAARKKQRKQEEEDIWNSYEKDRVVVFNTTEYQNFHSPTLFKDEPNDNFIRFSDAAMQVDAPMRIACYCRHMNEKTGFQVIFTIKDYRGNFIAQTMTQSIHITDDHKTHGPASAGGQDYGFADQTQLGGFGGYMTSDGSSMIHGNLPHRQYHSTTDLTALSRNLGQGPWPGSGLSQSSNPFGGGSSSTLSHHRTLSRPASPSAQMGPKKKRKGSAGQQKVPANLLMTRADQPLPLSIPDITSGSLLATATSFSPESSAFTTGAEQTFGLSQGSLNAGFHTGPPTPNSAVPMFATANRSGSIDNLNNYFYSAPNSAHPSRAASPTSFSRPQMTFTTPAPQLAENVAGGLVSMQMPGVSQRPQPTIQKILPAEGPKTGGIEVVVLGTNFDRTHEVCFGEVKAITTTVWSPKTLVCIVPPSPVSGTVAVTFAHQHQAGYSPSLPSSPALFKYVDDTDKQLFETCVRILVEKEIGPGVDHRTYATRVVQSAALAQAGAYGNPQNLGFDLSTIPISEREDILLSILNKVDLADSPFEANFDLQQANGATMLWLASALGYNRLVAGLLARGADPDLPNRGGFTPLMMGTMNGNAQIVRRLILKGADATKRSLNGLVATDLATSAEMSAALRQVRHHLRSSSAGTPFRSRANSATSTRSLWGPPSPAASSSMFTTEDESAVDSSEEDIPVLSPSPVVMRSRRNSAAISYSRRGSAIEPGGNGKLHAPAARDVGAEIPYPYAVMAAWRENLAAQIQLFQQSAAWTLPNIQLPTLPSLQEQNFPSWRRLSSLVPNRPTFLSSPTTPIPPEDDHEDTESTASPPPAYGEIFPENADMPLDSKPPELTVTSVDSSFATQSVSQPSSSRGESSQTITARRQNLQLARKRSTLRIGKGPIREEQILEARQLRKEKLTCAKDDRNLWIVWFPLLIALAFWWYSGLEMPSLGSWMAVGGRAFRNGRDAQVPQPLAV